MKKKLICLAMAVMALAPISVSANTTMRGDVNNNGVINNYDLELLQRYTLGDVSASAINAYGADVDGNGTIQVADVATLKQKLSRVVRGDVDGSGVINNYDLQLLQSYTLGDIPASAINTYGADVDGNGTIQVADVATLKQKLSKIQKGDVDADGSISPIDLTYLKRFMLGDLNNKQVNEYAADVNGDGAVTAADIVALQKKLL